MLRIQVFWDVTLHSWCFLWCFPPSGSPRIPPVPWRCWQYLQSKLLPTTAEGLNSRLTDFLSVMTPSEDQLMALFWVSARVVNQCSEVSQEHTDPHLQGDWLWFTWMLKWQGRKKSVGPVSAEITNKMQPCNGIYYSTVYGRLNMFRAAYRSSSEALNCICSLWFTYACGDRP
jgi:hypothetical protein